MTLAPSLNSLRLNKISIQKPKLKGNRQMNKLISSLLLTVILAAMPLNAANASAYLRQFRDIKLPTQAIMEHQLITDPIVATTNRIKTTYAGATSAAAVTLSSFTAQPDVPRNLTITPTGTTGDVESCVITVTGTNFFGATITEAFTFAADASTAQTGAKAFKTVSSVAFPADCESGGFAATWIIGVGEKLGAKRCMAAAGNLVFSTVAGVYETTRATVTADADEVEKNTFDFNGTMDASADFDAYFIQNWGCAP